jgi:hypothetical protein
MLVFIYGNLVYICFMICDVLEFDFNDSLQLFF